MAYDDIVTAGASGYLMEVALRSSTTGNLKTGVLSGAMSIILTRQGAASSLVVTPDGTMLQGTWKSGGWIETDNPGIYQFGSPNVALVAGVNGVEFRFSTAGGIDIVKRVLLTPEPFRLAGAGAFSVTVQVTDSDTNPVGAATVTFSKGSERYTQYTPSNGIIAFSLSAGTWDLAIVKAGYLYTATSQPVSSTLTLGAVMTIVTIPVPSDPTQITAVGKVFGGIAGGGDKISYWQVKPSPTTGIYNGGVKTVVSDASSVVTLLLYLGTEYEFWYGESGEHVSVVTPAVDLGGMTLPSIMGAQTP
jgi:hypothetical protein